MRKHMAAEMGKSGQIWDTKPKMGRMVTLVASESSLVVWLMNDCSLWRLTVKFHHTQLRHTNTFVSSSPWTQAVVVE